MLHGSVEFGVLELQSQHRGHGCEPCSGGLAGAATDECQLSLTSSPLSGILVMSMVYVINFW
jgi:hypothetical protein